MKKASIVLSVLFVMAIVLSSCRTQKQACAAYSKVEQPKQSQDTPG
jgi:PBP1b-binding outer membrane lipoprotein LpoB